MTGPNHRVSPKEAGLKLRQWLKDKSGASSKATNALIDAGGVTVNGKVERFGSIPLKMGQVIAWNESKLPSSGAGNSKPSKTANVKPNIAKTLDSKSHQRPTATVSNSQHGPTHSSPLDKATLSNTQHGSTHSNSHDKSVISNPFHKPLAANFSADRVTHFDATQPLTTGESASHKTHKLSNGGATSSKVGRSETSSELDVKILYENDELLVYLKPPGIPSQRTKDAQRSNAEDLVARWAQKNGRSRTILVHRLDRDTSGLLLFGKGEASATRLADWFKHRQVHKTYFALCHGATSLGKGTWEHFLGKGKMIGGRQAYSCVRSGGLKAITDYEILASAQGFSLWKLQPHTGRTHQLRVQLTQAGFPIVGDDLYGSRTPSHSVLGPAPHHYLHAGELCLPEEAGCPSPLMAPLPPAFGQALQQLGWLQHFGPID